MIALLLGIISFVIAIMFTTSFDKLANEVRDMRIKYLKIDTILSILKEKNNIKKKDINGVEEEQDDRTTLNTQENYSDHDTIIEEEELQSALTFENNNDYYENVQFKETFKEGDIIEVFT